MLGVGLRRTVGCCDKVGAPSSIVLLDACRHSSPHVKSIFNCSVMTDPGKPEKPEPSPHEKTLVRIMVLGTSLSFGILGAIALSMKDFIGGNAAFEFSLRTIVGFFAGCVVGWLFWKFIR